MLEDTGGDNEVLEIFAEALKICCETANKGLNNITNRVNHFIKEGNISKLSSKNMHGSSLFDSCTNWHIATDLEHHFVFPTEIKLMTQGLDIVIWSVKIDWAHQHKLEKYEDLQEQCVRNGWKTNVFPIEVGCRSFLINSTSTFLTNLRLSPSDKRNYINKIQDKALTASVWIWQSYRETTIQQSLMVL